MVMLVLVCASLASLALGVSLAYAICKWMFFMFRAHARSLAPEGTPVATIRAVHSS